MCVNNKYSNVILNTPPGGRLRNYIDWLIKIQMFQEKDSDLTKNLMDDKYWTREFVQIKYGLRGYPNFDTRNTWLLQGQQEGVEPIRILTSRDPKLIRSGLKTRRVEGGEQQCGCSPNAFHKLKILAVYLSILTVPLVKAHPAKDDFPIFWLVLTPLRPVCRTSDVHMCPTKQVSASEGQTLLSSQLWDVCTRNEALQSSADMLKNRIRQLEANGCSENPFCSLHNKNISPVFTIFR